MFHQTKEPLMEEFSIAKQVRLTVLQFTSNCVMIHLYLEVLVL
eukprot:COSAG04_NODE_1078_length_8422_cov_5.090833_13_plen_43_part_00